MSTENVLYKKKKLLENIDKLSESDIQEIMDFVDFILSKHNKEKKHSQLRKLDPKEDPILKLMGIADVKPFAYKIDQELYG